MSVRHRLLRQGQKLVVRGSLIPASEAYGKRIQLQRRDGRRWRPVADGRVARSGRFVFRYQFRRQGGHAVSMRIAAPKERGWAFAPVVSPIFLVRIGEMIDEESAGRATPGNFHDKTYRRVIDPLFATAHADAPPVLEPELRAALRVVTATVDRHADAAGIAA